MALDQGGDGGDQLGQRGAQSHHREGDDRFRYAQPCGDDHAVVHHQVGAHGDEGGGQDKPHQLHRQASAGALLCRLTGRGGRRGAPGGGDLRRHIGREHRQQDDAHPPAEHPGGVCHRRVKDRRHKEEAHRQPQGGGVRLAGPDRNGDRRHQRRIADDGADGVAIGDLPMAAHGRGRRDHHLGQGGAHRHHRGPDQQVGQAEPPGDPHRSIHEPVAALDQAEQPYTE